MEIKPCFEEAKKQAKRLVDYMNDPEPGLSTYWWGLSVIWKDLKKAMGE